MLRMNLKELRDALNKLPEKVLDRFAIAPDFCIEDPEGKFGLIYIQYEDATDEECLKLYDEKSMKEIEKRLVNFLNSDANKFSICKLDKDMLERYSEDGSEPDWEESEEVKPNSSHE